MIKLLVHNDKGEYELLDTHETEIDEVFLIRGEHFNHAETDRHAYHFDKKFDYAELVELGVYCYNQVRGWYRLEDAVPKEPEGSIVYKHLEGPVFATAYSAEEAHRFWEATELTEYLKARNNWISRGPSNEPEGTVMLDFGEFIVTARTPEHAQLIWESL